MDKIDEIKIIAHRGASRLAPENTLAAINRALEIGVDGIEIDTLLTSDKTAVVTHNDDLRILAGRDGSIGRLPRSVVTSLDVGSHFSDEFKGERIPLLTEVIDAMSGSGVMLMIEVKAQWGKVTEAATVVGRIVADASQCCRMVVTSSNPAIIYMIKRRHPKIETGVIVCESFFSFLASGKFAKLCGNEIVCPRHDLLDGAGIVRRAARRAPVYVWTVNDEEGYVAATENGAAGVITDDVLGAKEFFKIRSQHGRR